MMTPREIAEEMSYRRGERLGSLCPVGTPTPEQHAIAQAEADQWLREHKEGQQKELWWEKDTR